MNGAKKGREWEPREVKGSQNRTKTDVKVIKNKNEPKLTEYSSKFSKLQQIYRAKKGHRICFENWSKSNDTFFGYNFEEISNNCEKLETVKFQ